MKDVQITNNVFKDATESFEDTGHSMDARDMMTKYLIGSFVRLILIIVVGDHVNL